jgi:hypothetical protein
MKINPPKALIGKEDPFEHALFGRKEFAESLNSLLRNVNESLVVFVNAPWGEGKTTFSEMWRAQLKQRNLEVIYFDAYAADYFDDPFVSFSGEILELADKKLSEGKGLIERREFKETAIEVGKRLAGLAVKVGLRAASLGAVESAHMDEFKEIAAGVSEITADAIEKKIENWGVEKDALKKFKESLAKLAAKVREEQKFPLTIIVDELDRCRPDFALGLLERIKHLFDVEGVAFVLLVNRKQIESYIRTVYGNQDAEVYLLKFGNLFVDLPNQQSLFSHSERGRRDFCHMLFPHYGFLNRVKDGNFLARSLELLVEHFDLTLREIEKAFAIMCIYYSSLPANQLTNEFLIAMLSVLKVKYSAIYQKLSARNISVEHFFQETRLDKIKQDRNQGVSHEWVKDMLNFCLMSDAEYTNATKSTDVNNQGRSRLSGMGQWLISYELDREKVIPFFCSRLDRFSIQPQ